MDVSWTWEERSLTFDRESWRGFGRGASRCCEINITRKTKSKRLQMEMPNIRDINQIKFRVSPSKIVSDSGLRIYMTSLLTETACLHSLFSPYVQSCPKLLLQNGSTSNIDKRPDASDSPRVDRLTRALKGAQWLPKMQCKTYRVERCVETVQKRICKWSACNLPKRRKHKSG